MTNADGNASEAEARHRALIAQWKDAVSHRQWDTALQLVFNAVRDDQRNSWAAHHLGVLLSKVGRLKEGEMALRHSLSIAPGVKDTLHALAHNLLAQGRLQEGWAANAVRADMPELNTGFPRDFAFPHWQGQPLAGKRIAVFPEQGLGDQIQFARFLPRLIAEAGAVTLLAMRPLERLFRANFPGADIVAADGKVEFPDPDYWVTLQELPALLGVTLETIPAQPYLKAPDSGIALPNGFKIGFKASGNPRFKDDSIRSLTADMSETLRARLPGTVISLEPQDSGATDMGNTAALIDQLDLVVSVDTSVAHLAGAMGKQCLLLISGFSPDARWMFGRDDSPWYPQHRLYRSALSGDWAPAVDRLVRDIGNFMAPSRRLMRDAALLRSEGRFSESLAVGRKALAADPRNGAALHNVARLLNDLGRLGEGEKLHRRALALAPDHPTLLYGLGLNLLAQGRYREAWPYYEARTRLPSLNIGFPQNVSFPRWQGEDLAGKRIAVFPEQGFGDQLQFARFVPWLRDRGAEVVLLAVSALVELFRAAFPDVTVVAAEGTASFPKCDMWTTVVDLARHADIMPETLPAGDYLRVAGARERPEAGLRIGVMTRGNPVYIHDVHRSLPDSAATALRRTLPGELVELDPAISGARDFADTARIIAELDMVVSVDTSVGHLAGAMGKPCLLLIGGFASDWRWMRGRDDSPWYPGHRLFRGAIGGDWDGAIGRLCYHARMLANAAALPS